jgi:hypothetical protein
VRGIDAILGGHTHDGMPVPRWCRTQAADHRHQRGLERQVSRVLDFDVRDGQVRGFQYRLLPVFANILPADAQMQALITGACALKAGWAKCWRAPTARCTAAATSTARATSCCWTP